MTSRKAAREDVATVVALLIDDSYGVHCAGCGSRPPMRAAVARDFCAALGHVASKAGCKHRF